MHFHFACHCTAGNLMKMICFVTNSNVERHFVNVLFDSLFNRCMFFLLNTINTGIKLRVVYCSPGHFSYEYYFPLFKCSNSVLCCLHSMPRQIFCPVIAKLSQRDMHEQDMNIFQISFDIFPITWHIPHSHNKTRSLSVLLTLLNNMVYDKLKV